MFTDSRSNNLITEELRASTLNEIREKGSAFRRVKEYNKEIEIVPYGTNKKTQNKYGFNKTEESSVFEEVVSFVDNNYGTAFDSLSNDRFTINYNIYGDIKRSVTPGENTLGVRAEIDWKKKPVRVLGREVGGSDCRLELKPVFKLMCKNQTPIMNEIIKQANFERRDVTDMASADAGAMLTMMKLAIKGSSVLGRLVKGFLHAIDRIVIGDHKFAERLMVHKYDVKTITRAANEDGCTYIWCNSPNMQPRVMMSKLMASEYPYPDIPTANGHITFPAEQEEVKVISTSTNEGSVYGNMTASIAISAVVEYGVHMGMGDRISEAWITACSLSENKYLSKIKLPSAVGYCDLLRPMMTPPASMSGDRPIPNKEMTITIGRIHQMNMLNVVKEFIIAARNGSRGKANWGLEAERILKSQAALVRGSTENVNSLDLLRRTKGIRWTECVSQNDIQAINNESIFDSLWLVGPQKTGLQNGMLHSMFKGNHDGILLEQRELLIKNSKPVLDWELRNAGIEEKDIKLPRGSYIVEAACFDPEVDEDDFELDREFGDCGCRGLEENDKYEEEYEKPEKEEEAAGEIEIPEAVNLSAILRQLISALQTTTEAKEAAKRNKKEKQRERKTAEKEEREKIEKEEKEREDEAMRQKMEREEMREKVKKREIKERETIKSWADEVDEDEEAQNTIDKINSFEKRESNIEAKLDLRRSWLRIINPSWDDIINDELDLMFFSKHNSKITEYRTSLIKKVCKQYRKGRATLRSNPGEVDEKTKHMVKTLDQALKYAGLTFEERAHLMEEEYDNEMTKDIKSGFSKLYKHNQIVKLTNEMNEKERVGVCEILSGLAERGKIYGSIQEEIEMIKAVKTIEKECGIVLEYNEVCAMGLGKFLKTVNSVPESQAADKNSMTKPPPRKSKVQMNVIEHAAKTNRILATWPTVVNATDYYECPKDEQEKMLSVFKAGHPSTIAVKEMLKSHGAHQSWWN